MLRTPLAVAAALLAALSLTEPASAFTSTHLTVAADDGTNIQATLYEPEGKPPEAGWPAILMLHRLGGSRLETNALAEAYFAPAGYAVLAYDARGHRESGGMVTLAGAREVEDVRDLHAVLADLDEIDDKRIGAWGVSYGGAQALLAAGFGVPFAAVVTVDSWADLYSALFPADLPKSGVVGGFLNEVPPFRLDPRLDFLRTDAILGRNLDALRQFAAARSPLGVLGSLSTPTLIVKGRRDFAFGIDQAIAAFDALRGAKRLYVGHSAYVPASFPAVDTEYTMTLARRWFDRFLKGEANGVDTEPPFELAPDPWRGSPVTFPGLPPTRTLTYGLPGAGTIGRRDRVTRDIGPTRAALETFGAATVRVRATARGGWSRLVALLTAVTPAGKEIVVGAGGVPTTAGTRTYTIGLTSDVTSIPRGARLRVTFASTTVATAGGLLYLDLAMPVAARLTLRHATLSLPVLGQPVSS